MSRGCVESGITRAFAYVACRDAGRGNMISKKSALDLFLETCCKIMGRLKILCGNVAKKTSILLNFE